MLACRAIHRMGRDVHVLQDPERNECSDALTVRRNLMQLIAIGLDADGLHPLGRKRFEVRYPHRSSVLCRMRRRCRRNLAAIEGRTMRVSDGPKGTGRLGKYEPLADARC